MMRHSRRWDIINICTSHSRTVEQLLLLLLLLQVERFACLYTSHVSNMSFYSPDKCYRARMDHMAHEEDPIFSSSSC